MNILNIKDIHAICQAGSLRKAAKLLGISQPTLGNRLTRLEEELGVLLFERGKGKTRPTRIAEFISERSSGLIADSESLIQEAKEIASGSRGVIRIGFGPGCAHVLLTRIVKALRDRDSNISLETHTGTTHRLTRRLADGELDLVLGPFDDDQADPRLEVELMLEDQVVVVLDPSHPLLTQQGVDAEAIFQYPIAITNLEPRYQRIVREQYGHAMGEWDRSVLCSNYSLLLKIIKDGQHVSAGPRFALLDEMTAGEVVLVPVPDGPLPHQEHIIRNRYGFPYPARQFIESIVKEEMKEFRRRLEEL